uniref:Uncharacterized protein n=1 Tax=Latimeria chalumnae TaxID=7897 RepID=H2ZTK4_LATCH
SLIPPNIRHKFGSAIVAKYVSEEQVRGFSFFFLATQFQIRPPFVSSDPQLLYKELSDIMRRNVAFVGVGTVFRVTLCPGNAQTGRSLVQDSYTKEVHQRRKWDPEHWHGRKTDELGRWTERNFRHLQLKKDLEEMRQEKKVKKNKQT